MGWDFASIALHIKKHQIPLTGIIIAHFVASRHNVFFIARGLA